MNLKSLVFKMSAACIVAAGIHACSSSGEEGIYGYVNSQQMLYVSLNLNDVYDNAGFEVSADGVKPSEAFRRLMQAYDSTKVMHLLDMRGIDLDNVLVMFDAADNAEEATMVFAIDDKARFDSYMQSNNLTPVSDNGMEVYSLGTDAAVVVDGGCGLIVEAAPKLADKVKELKKSARKNPLKPWQKEALAKDHSLSMVVNLNEAYGFGSGVVGASVHTWAALGYPEGTEINAVLSSDLSGLEWSGECTLFDSEGRKMEPKIEYNNLASSLMDYACSSDVAMLLTVLPKNIDYAPVLKSLGNPKLAGQVSTVLNSIHSVMIAGGPLRLAAPVGLDGLTAVIAAELAPGSALEYFNQLSSLAPMLDVDVKRAGNEASASLPDMNLAMKADGDNLVIALNSAIPGEGGSPFTKGDFGKLGGFRLEIPADSQLAAWMGVPFGIQARISSDEPTLTTWSLRLAGAKGKLLENIIEFAASKQ